MHAFLSWHLVHGSFWRAGVPGGLGQVGIGPSLAVATSRVLVFLTTEKQQRFPSLVGTASELTQGGPGWGELPQSWTGGTGETLGRTQMKGGCVGRCHGSEKGTSKRDTESARRASGVRAWGAVGSGEDRC